MTVADKFGEDVLRRLVAAGFEERDFQISAASVILEALREGNNALLSLPPGLGKTLISQLVMASWKLIRRRPQLCIVPTTLLVEQHVDSAAWLTNRLDVETFSPGENRKPAAVRSLVLGTDVLVTTPAMLWNTLTTGVLSFSYLDSIGLCVIDEYDEFTKGDQGELRIHAALAPLLDALLKRNVPILGLSAASPDLDPKAVYWARQLNPVICAPTGADIARYLPAINIHFCGVHDGNVVAEDLKIADTISKLLRSISKLASNELGIEVDVDLDDIIFHLPAIVTGKKSVLPLHIGTQIIALRISPELINLCAQIQSQLSQRLLLFEDMGDVDLSTSVKATSVANIIRARHGDLGLLMVRYIQIAEHLSAMLEEKGIATTVVHGEVERARRTEEIQYSRTKQSQVLILTRRLGGRGFDFPQADYAIFYSPKEDEGVMWQELLRIRSNRSRVKPVYILHYSSTTESSKATTLRESMQGLPTKGYTFSDPPPFLRSSQQPLGPDEQRPG